MTLKEKIKYQIAGCCISDLSANKATEECVSICTEDAIGFLKFYLDEKWADTYKPSDNDIKENLYQLYQESKIK